MCQALCLVLSSHLRSVNCAMCLPPWLASPGRDPFSFKQSGEFVVLACIFNGITTEVYGDQAIYSRPNRSQITMLTMNPGLFPKVLSTTSTASSMYPMEQTNYLSMVVQNIRQCVLQKSSSSVVLSVWQLFDYLLNTCILYICLDTYMCLYIYNHLFIS